MVAYPRGLLYALHYLAAQAPRAVPGPAPARAPSPRGPHGHTWTACSLRAGQPRTPLMGLID